MKSYLLLFVCLFVCLDFEAHSVVLMSFTRFSALELHMVVFGGNKSGSSACKTHAQPFKLSLQPITVTLLQALLSNFADVDPYSFRAIKNILTFLKVNFNCSISEYIFFLAQLIPVGLLIRQLHSLRCVQIFLLHN